MRTRGNRGGQAALEFAILYAAVLLPLTFSIVFAAEMLWVWHSAVDFTRDGARYAATHCYMGGGENVVAYMRTHVPRMVDMDQFMSGQAEITVSYFQRDPVSGTLADFPGCDAECSLDCIPDAVTVSITNYEFRRFVNFFGLPPVRMPDFRASLAIQSAGCDPEQGACLP